MVKRNVRYPHTIGFRITDETWIAIQQEISQADLTPTRLVSPRGVGSARS